MQATTMCVVPIAPETTLRLTVSKATALRHLKARIGQGLTIRRRHVRYMEDLEEARAEKSAWLQDYTELLRQMFHGDAGRAVAEACNDWVGRVYPEYADMELFAGQFYEEMDHRIARLRAVVLQVAALPEYVPAPTRTDAGATGGAKVELLDAPARGQAPSPLPPAAPASAPAGTAAKTGAAKPPGNGAAASAPAAPVATEADLEDARPAPGGLLVVHEGAGAKSELVRAFLHDLGIAPRAVSTTSQDAKAATAALEQHRDAAAFALLLLPADDVARLRAAPGLPGPVTFQLGYLAGRLGLTRVCILCDGGQETFIDPHGVLCLPLDPANGWHLQLARHLKRAGIEVDLNKLC